MSKSDFINAENILPPPSILEKLLVLDPESPEWVMKRAEEISAQKTGTDTRTAIPQNPALRLNFSFAAAGDNIRQAMREYMALKKLDAKILGLTETEVKGLAPVLKYEK